MGAYFAVDPFEYAALSFVPMILAALVGNSTVRYARLGAEEVLERGTVPIPPDGTPLPGGWVPRGSFQAVVVGSVNPRRLGETLSALSGLTVPVLVAGRDLPIPIPNRYRDASEAGADRLLNALAASRLWPGQGVVVLDFGTALSVSVVSPSVSL